MPIHLMGEAREEVGEEGETDDGEISLAVLTYDGRARTHTPGEHFEYMHHQPDSPQLANKEAPCGRILP